MYILKKISRIVDPKSGKEILESLLDFEEPFLFYV